MQKRLLRWELIGFAFTGAVGTLLHFVYEWTGGNPLIAAFCAVNESTWEHMKLLFVPFFLFTMVQFIVFAEPLRSFFAAKAASILLGLLAIPVLFYSLGGMFGKTPDWVNIAIFFLADALLYLMSFRLLTRGALRGGAWQLAGFLLLWALAFAFVFFTPTAPSTSRSGRTRRMGSTGSPRQGPRDNSHHLVQQGGQPPQRLPSLPLFCSSFQLCFASSAAPMTPAR